MAQRLLEVVLPAGVQDFDELFEGGSVVATWRAEPAAERLLVQVLVDAEQAEPLLDRLTDRHGTAPGFRVVLLPVEASLPARRPESEKPPSGQRRRRSLLSRAEVQQELEDGARLSGRFLALTVLSVAVACVGLLRDDLAVVIGAMVIAPLLGPNVALSLAVTLGDGHFARRALMTSVAGAMLAFGLSVVAGLLLQVDHSVPALAARTQVQPDDVVLALAAGVAAALSVTGSLSGAVIGVMVAVALLPPLVTAGLLLGGGRPELALGAVLLTATNVVGLNLAAVTSFVAQGVRPRTWWEAERAKAATKKALAAWSLLLLLLLVLLFWGPVSWLGP